MGIVLRPQAAKSYMQIGIFRLFLALKRLQNPNASTYNRFQNQYCSQTISIYNRPEFSRRFEPGLRNKRRMLEFNSKFFWINLLRSQVNPPKRLDWSPALRGKMQQMMIEANWYGEYGAKHIPQCNTVTASMVKVVANAHQLPADERLLTRVRGC
jgi:hypothetical protein